ncbi:putative katanin [Trypanosoma grayi]|uniref:putative katanin n=1 Tax=Trypanosoma grayi TaxID=71804 RepID=UPI0004F41E21|nr:putative katanin [Trypanosoma grayi]KEG13617.1 putative katanin [Trypanosoma grayi]
MQHKNNLRLQPLSNDTEGAPGSSLQAIKLQQKAREEDERVRLKRVKGALVLILQFLLDQGYTGALQMLQQESRVALQQFCPADNIDLLAIIAEYEQYFEFRFNRRPKLFRVVDGGQDVTTEVQSGECMAVRRRPNGSAGARQRRLPGNVNLSKVNYANAANLGGDAPPNNVQETQRPPGASPGLARGLALAQKPSTPPSPQRLRPPKKKPVGTDVGGMMGVAGLRLDVVDPRSPDVVRDGAAAAGAANDEDVFFGRGLKPLPRFPSLELQDLAMTIQRDILDVNPNVRWSSIAALDQAKQLLKEAVVMPVKYPELFAGIVRPWKGILLFGPPGTGKTLLAKAVATECRTTFFNISASSVVSKWRGDSEKLVRLLFDLAVHYAPSTIFIDEIDSLMSSRSGDGMHEGSRRMKTELLIQMDGLSKRQGGEVVFVLAASNVPWDLDTAMLRRLEKRILVGLPTHEARAIMFRQTLTPAAAPDLDWNICANITDGMSGADIDVVCREAMMRPIRLMIEKLEHAGHPSELTKGALRRPLVTLNDVRASVACTQSTVRQAELDKYDQWVQKYGSGVSS